MAGYLHVALISLMFATGTSETGKPPPPKLIQNGKYLSFESSIINPVQCWKCNFIYIKCKEVSNITTSNCLAQVDYDTACKYTVKVQQKYEEHLCGMGNDSEMSEPTYYGQDGDPDMPFKVAIIVIPGIVSCCLIVALVQFWRHKEKIFPKIPSPAHLYDLADSPKIRDLTQGLNVGDLYVAPKEEVENVTVELNTALLP